MSKLKLRSNEFCDTQLRTQGKFARVCGCLLHAAWSSLLLLLLLLLLLVLFYKTLVKISKKFIK